MAIVLNLAKYSFIVAFTILASSQAILNTWSKIAGQNEYIQSTMDLSVESLKCAISLLALFKIWKSDGRTQNNKLSITFDQAISYCIPATLCYLYDLLQGSLFAYMDGRTEPLNILNKISNVVLSRIILKKKLTRFQLFAFGLLCVGHTLVQLNTLSEPTLQGWIMAIVLAFLSGLTDVSKEAVIKKHHSTNINVHNFWLSIFGLFFHLVAVCNHELIEINPKGLFYGYTYITVCMILNHALRGIAVSMVLKHADNIMKVYSTSVAMLLTAIISKFLFGFQLSIISFGGFMLVLVSVIFHGVGRK